MYIYRTYFNLTADVKDFDAARDFLKDDDMKQYMKGDKRVPDNVYETIESIDWILKDVDSGIIELKTTRELTQKELENISDWVCGQCSDGLGESFEQQSFANYEDDEYNYDDEDGEYYDDNDNYIMASFDWKTNNYIFELVRQE